MTKSHRLPFFLSTSQSVEPFQLVYSDLWGPSPINSVNGARYFLLFIDDYTKFSWLYLLQSKSVVPAIFHQFKAMIENQFNTTIKSIQTDGGTKFRPLYPFFSTHGITHRISCPYTPQQNGCVERKNRHVVEVGLALLAHSALPKSFWPFAFQAAIYLINRLPTKVLNYQSPYQALHKHSPDYKLLRCFGFWMCLLPFSSPFQ